MSLWLHTSVLLSVIACKNNQKISGCNKTSLEYILSFKIIEANHLHPKLKKNAFYLFHLLSNTEYAELK